MKAKDEFKRYDKAYVYDTYLRIVNKPKMYGNITREKMIDEIMKQYKEEYFLYSICTERELKFLNLVINGKKIELLEDDWEINQLHKKCIFSKTTLNIYDEQVENVKNALKLYKEYAKKNENLVLFLIGKVREFGEISTDVLINILKGVCEINDEQVDIFLNTSLFHYYCDYKYKYLELISDEVEVIYYRDYYSLLDELDDAREEYGVAGEIWIDVDESIDMFYYGMPIKKPIVKKLYDKVNKNIAKDLLLEVIDESRVLYNRMELKYIFEENMLTLVNDALDEMPCSAMNGFTPNNRDKEINKSVNLDNNFKYIPQNNAHLCKKAADEYYKIYFAILEFVNNREKICPELKKIYKQEGLDVRKLYKIDEFLWNHKNIIDEFIKLNSYNFNKQELDEVKEFKNAITSEHFIVVGFDREYTKILSTDGKIYMVKGIRSDFDEIINPKDIPKVIGTTLLMFKDNIVFKSFFTPLEIKFGNDIKKQIVDEMNNAMVYYHL